MSTSPNRGSKTPVQLVTVPDQPAAVQAVSLALGVLRHASLATWAKLVEHFAEIPAGLELSEEQIRLLAEWQHLLPHIAWGSKSADGPGASTVTLAVCPECGRWEQVVGAASSRCRLKLLCPGVPVKAAVARKAAVAQQTLPANDNTTPVQPELIDAEPPNTSIGTALDPSDEEF